MLKESEEKPFKETSEEKFIKIFNKFNKKKRYNIIYYVSDLTLKYSIEDSNFILKRIEKSYPESAILYFKNMEIEVLYGRFVNIAKHYTHINFTY